MMEAPTRSPSLLEWAQHALEPLGYTPAEHHRTLLSALERVSAGQTERLMVLMPPGSAKSTYVSHLFPAWWFTRHPRSSVISACHTASLAGYFGRRARGHVAANEAYLGYGIDPASRAADQWATSAGGEYYAAGVRGPITGRRADLAIIDDPIKGFADADSAVQREHVWDWYRADLSTRLTPRGRIVLVMTRWHEDDLGGRLLASGEDWTVIRMPALSPDGRALWPSHQNVAALDKVRVTLGQRVWSALFQQSPGPGEGALFTVARIPVLDSAPEATRLVRAWDLAATAAVSGRDPDWTVGLKLGRDPGGRCTVHDIVRFRGGPHEVEEAIVRTAASDGRAVTVGLPQDPGQAGKQQVAWLTARLAGFRVVSSAETGAKLTRAMPVAAQADGGNLAVVAGPWSRAFLDELRDFPHGRKDDQVDALSRAFSMIAETALPARRVNVPILGR
jgi:predicted phage terminase large subunit-like protein